MNIDCYNEFPITRKWIYLNHALMAPLPRKSHLSASGLLNRLAHNGPQARNHINYKNNNVFKELGQFLNCPKENIVLFKNISEAILFLRHRLPLKQGSKIMGVGIPEAQKASWEIWKPRNIQVNFSDHNILNDPTEFDSASLLALNPLSEHQPSFTDIHSYSEICTEREILLLADLGFIIGTQRIYPLEMGIDIALMETHRWMLGIPDITVMCVTPDIAKALKLRRPMNLLKALGHNTESDNDPTQRLDFTNPSAPFDHVGSIASKAALLESTKILNEIGMSEIENRIKALKVQIMNGLREEGFEILSDAIPGVVSAKHNQIQAQDLCEKLLTHDIQVGWKRDQLWISPHFYNSETEIETFLKTLRLTIET